MLVFFIVLVIALAILPIIGTVALANDWPDRIRDWLNGI